MYFTDNNETDEPLTFGFVQAVVALFIHRLPSQAWLLLRQMPLFQRHLALGMGFPVHVLEAHSIQLDRRYA